MEFPRRVSSRVWKLRRGGRRGGAMCGRGEVVVRPKEGREARFWVSGPGGGE